MNRWLKGCAYIILIAFFTIAIDARNFVYAKDFIQNTKDKQRAQQIAAITDFSKEIAELNKLIAQPPQEGSTPSGKKQALSSQVQLSDEEIKVIKAKLDNINELSELIKEEFEQTEKSLINKGVSGVILQRHADFVKQFEDKIQALQEHADELEAITASGIKKGINRVLGKKAPSMSREEKVHQLREFLQENTYQTKRKPLDPNKLPHRMLKLPHREPRIGNQNPQKTEKPQETKTIQESKAHNLINKVVLYIADFFVAEAQAADLPTDEDLAETIDVQITDEIRTLATETLRSNPVLIYEYVRKFVDYEPYYGSLKGSQETLWEMAGNDFDQASLLIALYRAAGIPARYVYGTIEIPINQAMNWVGVEKPELAAEFLADTGHPAAHVFIGGEIKRIQVEHIWVEAWVTHDAYKGARQTDKNKVWIPLLPSLNRYKETEGVNYSEIIPFDGEALLNQLQETGTIDEDSLSITNIDVDLLQTSIDDYKTQIQTYIEENTPEATVGDIIGTRTIIEQDYGVLQLSLPVLQYWIHDKYTELPDSFRHKISFNIADISYTSPTCELAGKRITLSYAPVTSEDASMIQQNIGSEELPAYLINLKSELAIEGEVKGQGSSVGMGYKQTFAVDFIHPAVEGVFDRVEKIISAGSYHTVILNLQKIPGKLLQVRSDKMELTRLAIEEESLDYTTKDDIFGEWLYITGLTYWFQLDLLEFFTGKELQVNHVRDTSLMIVSIDMENKYLFSIPYLIRLSGIIGDVVRNVEWVKSVNGEKNQEFYYTLYTGIQSSVLESTVIEQLYGGEALSTMKVMQIANEQGIPIYNIDQDNISLILPRLQVEEHVKSDIQNAVNNGKIVIVPERNISFYEWSGTGYVILDPEDGSGAYMLSNGTAGFWWWVGVVGYVIAEMAFWLCVAVEVVLAVLFFLPLVAPALATNLTASVLTIAAPLGSVYTAIAGTLTCMQAAGIQLITTISGNAFEIAVPIYFSVGSYLANNPATKELLTYLKGAFQMNPAGAPNSTAAKVGLTTFLTAKFLTFLNWIGPHYVALINQFAQLSTQYHP